MAILMVGAAIWTSSGGKNAEVQMAKSEGQRSSSSALALQEKTLSGVPSPVPDTTGPMTNSILLAQAVVADAVATPSAASPVASFEMKQNVQAVEALSKGKDTAVSTLAANAPARALQEPARDKEVSYGRTAAVSEGALTERISDSLQPGVTPEANTRAAAPGVVVKTEVAPTQEQVQTFQNISMTQLFRNQMPADGQPAPATVMAQFRVEQDGAAVRIIDNDGSVYTGSLQEAEIAASAKPAPTVAMRADQKRFARPAAQASPDDTQNFRMEVTGTNRTLNQKVVFTGNLVGNQISLSNTTQNQQAARQNQKLQQQLSNVMRISGKARVGTGADQTVDAVPLP